MNASEPAELRRTATVARHHDMPTVAATLDAAADRIEGLEREVIEARYRPMGDNHHNALACPYCSPERAAASEPLQEVHHG